MWFSYLVMKEVVAENRDIVAMHLRVLDDIPMVTTRDDSHSALRMCATPFQLEVFLTPQWHVV